MGKKNLDKLFQEKFKDFEEIPDEKVWDAISNSLDKKKSRKLIPFWWKLGGVAALLAIMFIAINPFEDENNAVPILTDTEKSGKENPISNKEDAKIISSEEISNEQNQVADTDGSESSTDSNPFENQEADEEKIAIDKKKSNLNPSKKKQVNTSQLATSDSGKTVQKNKANAISEGKQTSGNTFESNEAVAEIDKRKSEENLKKESKKNLLNEKLNIDNSIEEGITSATDEKKDEELEDDPIKKSLFDEIEKQIEEEEAIVENSKNKWSVGANLAPVYFNSFGEGSSIDPAFNTNSKSGNLNMSYGLSVAYDVSKKLSIRTGISKIDFGYDTNEVEFSASVQGSLSSRLNNVDYNASAENVVVESKRANTFANENKGNADFALSASSIGTRNGEMAQEFGYIEVPVELDYTLIDSRFGVNLIGGVSTMFLTNNSVALNDSNETVELGEANNLNNMNFSTNVGFGLNYKFTPKLRLNVEPIFKYQLNTFSDTSGNFNPFSIGVYSGLNFRF